MSRFSLILYIALIICFSFTKLANAAPIVINAESSDNKTSENLLDNALTPKIEVSNVLAKDILATYQSPDFPSSGIAFAVVFTDKDNKYIAYNTDLYRTEDFGKTWTKLNLMVNKCASNFNKNILALYLSPDFSTTGFGLATVLVEKQNNKYIRNTTEIYRTQDFGKTWNKVNLMVNGSSSMFGEGVNFFDLAFLPENELLLSGYKNLGETGYYCFCYLSSDMGEHWSSSSSSSKISLHLASLLGNTAEKEWPISWATLSSSGIWDFSYRVGYLPSNAGIRSIQVINGKCVIYENDSLKIYDDTKAKVYLSDIYMLDDKKYYITSYGKFLYTEDDGNQWKEKAPTIKDADEIIDVGNTLVIKTKSQGYYYSSDQCASWNKLALPHFDIINFLPGYIIVGDSNGVTISNDLGQTWINVCSDNLGKISNLSSSINGEKLIIFVSSSKGIRKIEYNPYA